MAQNRNESIILKKLTPEYLDEALHLLDVGFYPHENVSMGCSLSSNQRACKELGELCACLAEDNISFIAIDSTSNKVVGALFNKIQKKCEGNEPSLFENFRDHHCTEPNSKSLIDFMLEFDSFIDIFSKFNVDQFLELMFFVVHPDYRNRGIGFSLYETSLNVIKEENSALKLASSTASSIFTYRILEKLQFDVVLKKEFNDFSYNNESYASKVDCKVHNTGIVLFVKHI